MDRFELLGPLPREGTTTVLEASAGTGKTFALAGLVTRYLAETAATLDEMLLITFNRAASRELRERVRGQIVEAVGALQGDAPPSGELVEHLLRGSDAERAQKRSRLRDALANFDAATIATTHEFCGSVLKSLGVAGDNAADVELKESLTDLVTEIVDDRYLANFGRQETDPELTYAEALALALAVVDDPCAQLRPPDPEPGSKAAVRLRFAAEVLEELERRKGRLRAQGFNDLLIRLATALEAADSPARDRMRERWRIVLVDEFQDTDPMQWRVLERAFSRHSALILIGDPKQAIYGFRGGDIHTYLKAAGTADARYTLGVNWRSDRALVESCRRCCAMRPWVTPTSSSAAPTPTTPGTAWPRRRARRRFGCAWSNGTRSGMTGPPTSRSRRCAGTSPTTWPPTSRRYWPAGPPSPGGPWWPQTSR